MNKLSTITGPINKGFGKIKLNLRTRNSSKRPPLQDMEALLQPVTNTIEAGKRTYLFFLLARIRRELRQRYRSFASVILYCFTKSVYQVEVNGLDNFTYSPSTILACSHKRDSDIGIIIPGLYTFRRPSSQKRMRLLYEVTRDDFYERGFLVNYFPLLDWARPVMARLSIARLMHALQTCPIKLPDEQTVNQLLQETKRYEGNLVASEALTEEWRKKLFGKDADKQGLTLFDAVLKAPYAVLTQYATPRMFKEPFCSRIRERHHQTMMQQLYGLTRILDKGGTLFVLPEGKLTPDGRFCKMRAALSRLVKNTRADVRMIPINVTYDFMDTRRVKAIMNVGEEIQGIKRYAKNELLELVGQVIPGLASVTMSGIASRKLIELAENSRPKISYFQFRDEIWEEFLRLREQGLAVDNRIENRQGFVERLERYINYCWRTGGIFLNKQSPVTLEQIDDTPLYAGDEWLYLDIKSLLRQECHRASHNPVRYCFNELETLLDARGINSNLTTMSENVVTFESSNQQQYTAG